MTVCSHTHKANNSKRVSAALVLNVLMMSIEFLVAYYTGSQSILASAIHDFGDSLALGLSLGLQVWAAKPADKYYHFGYGRFELLAGLTAGLVIFVSNLVIFYEVFAKFFQHSQGDHSQLSSGMIFVALFGIIINFCAFKLMHSNHSQHERALSIHFFQDTANWVAVLIGGVVIYFFHWYLMDSILALVIAGIMGVRVFREIKTNLGIFLQRTPNNVDLDFFQGELIKIPGVSGIAEIKIWSIDGVHHVAHISLNASLPEIKPQVQDICKKFHITEFFLDIVHSKS